MSDKPTGATGGAGRALIPFVPIRKAVWPQQLLRQGLLATGLVLAAGLGAAGVHTAQVAWAGHDRTTVQADATAAMLRQLEGEVGRLKGSVDSLRANADGSKDDTLRTLKRSVETLKAQIDQARNADGTTLAQIASKIDRADHDPSAKLAEIATRLDRIEHEPKATDATAPKVADLVSRLDRLEHQVSAPATTGSIPPGAAPPATSIVPRSPAALKPQGNGPVADAKPMQPRAPTVDAWVVRDVYDGMALVEARGGGLREIEPGEFLPGAGQVRTIERRGRNWVVLTSRGVIEASTF